MKFSKIFWVGLLAVLSVLSVAIPDFTGGIIFEVLLGAIAVYKAAVN